MRNTLVTAEEVIFHAPTKHTLDVRMIESSIIVAEERFIRPELGYSLYTSLVDKKNHLVTAADVTAGTYNGKLPDGASPVAGDLINGYEELSENEQKFWKQHLWKITAEAVMISAYPEGFVQFGTEGAFHNSPPAGLMVTSGNVVPLLTSMKWAIDKKVLDRLAPLISSMHYFICANRGTFPTYAKLGNCPNCDDVEGRAKFSGIALDIYGDDVDDNCCNEPGWK